jgi:hypothetical protein
VCTAGTIWRHDGQEVIDVTPVAVEVGLLCRTWMTRTAFGKLRRIAAECNGGPPEHTPRITFERFAVGLAPHSATVCMLVKGIKTEREILFCALAKGTRQAPSLLLTTMEEVRTRIETEVQPWN